MVGTAWTSRCGYCTEYCHSIVILCCAALCCAVLCHHPPENLLVVVVVDLFPRPPALCSLPLPGQPILCLDNEIPYLLYVSGIQVDYLLPT